MVPKTYSLREERLMAIAMSEHFHLSFKKNFLGQAFLLKTSLELVFFFHLGLKVESSHSAPENYVMLQIQRMRYRSYFHQKASIGLADCPAMSVVFVC